jgi:hypothetical protein
VKRFPFRGDTIPADLAKVVAGSRSLAHAAQRLGYNKATISRWVNSGKCPAPGTVVADEGATGESMPPSADPLHGYSASDLLDGLNRPGFDDREADKRWCAARRHVMRIAESDSRFDPRRVLELSIPAGCGLGGSAAAVRFGAVRRPVGGSGYSPPQAD